MVQAGLPCPWPSPSPSHTLGILNKRTFGHFSTHIQALSICLLQTDTPWIALGLKAFPVEEEAREEAYASLRVSQTPGIPEHDLEVVGPGPGWAQSLPSVDSHPHQRGTAGKGAGPDCLSLWPLTSGRNACESEVGTDLNLSRKRLEGQERAEVVVRDVCGVHSAAVLSPRCAYVPRPLQEDKQGGNTVTEADRGEMAGFELKGDSLAPRASFC